MANVIELVVKGTDNASSALEGIAGTLKALGIAAAAKEVGETAIELGNLGLQAQATDDRLVAFAGSAREAERFMDAMRVSTGRTVDSMTLANTASRMLGMGLASTAEEAAELAEMAVRLGQQHESAGTRLQTFNQLLANQSIEVLDSYNISSARVRVRIEELQSATEGMTREQAFQIAVLEEGRKSLEMLGDAGLEQAQSADRLTASWTDFKIGVGRTLAPALADLADAATMVTDALGDQVDELSDLEAEFGRAAVGAAYVEQKYGNLGGATRNSIEDLQALSAASALSRGQMNDYADMMESTAVPATQNLSDMYVEHAGITRDLSQAQGALNGTWYEGAAALEEMSIAQFAKQQLDALRDSIDGVTFTQEDYNEAARATLTELGLLTEAEVAAQGAIDNLTQQLIEGKVGPEEFALAVSNLKAELDGVPREIPITFKFNSEGTLPALPGAGDLTDPAKYGGMAAGGVSGGGWDWVGERGPELRYQQPGTRIVDHHTSRQIVNNQIFNLNGGSGMAFVVDQARRAQVR